jgi:hypothetical protein
MVDTYFYEKKLKDLVKMELQLHNLIYGKGEKKSRLHKFLFKRNKLKCRHFFDHLYEARYRLESSWRILKDEIKKEQSRSETSVSKKPTLRKRKGT